MKNRLLICTSPIQVIFAKAAIKKLQKMNIRKCKDYILIIHPELSRDNKKLIHKLAKKLDYAGVLDFTGEILNSYLKITTNIRRNIYLGNINKYFQNTYREYYNLQKKINIIVKDKIGNVDAVFYRNNYPKIDEFFITSLDNINKFYAIEDGIGTYVPKSNELVILHEVKHFMKQYIAWFILTLFSFSQNFNLYKCYKQYFIKNFKETFKFRNIDHKNSIQTKKEFIEVLKFLKPNKKYNYPIKVIIFGTIINKPNVKKYQFSLNDEIIIYKKLLIYLKQKYNINIREIYYKPHPRINKKTLNFYKKNLKCSFYNPNNNVINDIGELEFFNKELICTVSLGSTALLYSKNLFDIDSYIIDIRNRKSHPRVQNIAFKSYLKNGIKKINI